MTCTNHFLPFFLDQNLRTAPQSKDQTLTRGNLALSMSVESKQPVRVIRGYKLDSPFAPEEGYRYDGTPSRELTKKKKKNRTCIKKDKNNALE